MPTDGDFLAAIAAAPLDSLPKLVYADWLDERNDPRGELVRLDQELLTTPPAPGLVLPLQATGSFAARRVGVPPVAGTTYSSE